jgi:mRNA-degrading endonuclease RelE of RelBE toxin-antitoxin system
VREKRLKVVFAPAGVRDIESLEGDEAIHLVRDIQTYLETRPVPIGKPRIKKLSGHEPPLYRLRSGDFRAYYRISGDEVVVLAVTRRKDSAKRLKRISEESKSDYGRGVHRGEVRKAARA